MKHLSNEELSNLTDKKAIEVVMNFSDYCSNWKNAARPAIEIEDVLEYPREEILTCFLRLMKSKKDDKKFFDWLTMGVVILFTSFIPNEETYKVLLKGSKIKV